jgi:hypothetical protein
VTGGSGRTAALVAGALAALAVAGCSGGSGGSGQAATSSPAPTSSSSASGPPASGTASPSSPAPTSEPGPLTPVPSKSRATLAPAAPSRTVTVGGGARAVLISSRNVTVKGQGPGELSGPAVALTLQVTNGASGPLDLDAVTVTASIHGQEASSSDAAPAKPFAGRLAPGARTQAVYVFVLPAGVRRPVGVVVSLAPDLPVARFTVP